MSRSAFTRDTRAVAPVIGFILAIGILVLLLAVYQAQIVPQQNAETELEHHEDTQYELQSLHNAISAVGEDGDPRFQSVNLGTAYEGRTLGVNPAPPAGTIRTEEHNISITNGNGSQTNISTQFIEYQPGYNELDIGSTWYENSVLYLDERARGNSLNVIENQDLVEDGNVTIIALQNEFEKTGTSRIAFELYPSNNLDNKSLPEQDGNYTVEIPTRLNESYWETQFENELGDDIEQDFRTADTNVLNLTIKPDALELTSVGIQIESKEVDKASESEAADDLTSEDDGELIGDGAQAATGKFSFGLNNSGDSDLDIFAIGIVNASSEDSEPEPVNVTAPGEGNTVEFSQDNTDLVDQEIDFNSGSSGAEKYKFIEEVRISAEDTEDDFDFNRFRDDNGDQVEMEGGIVYIKVWVKDEGGEESSTILPLEDDNGGQGNGGN